MKGLPKFFFSILLVFSLISLVAYTPGVSLALEEDFTDEEEEEVVEEEEEEDIEEEEAEKVEEEIVEEEKMDQGQVLGGATELGDTGAEHLVYFVAGLVGIVAVVAGLKFARSDVEEY